MQFSRCHCPLDIFVLVLTVGPGQFPPLNLRPPIFDMQLCVAILFLVLTTVMGKQIAFLVSYYLSGGLHDNSRWLPSTVAIDCLDIILLLSLTGAV